MSMFSEIHHEGTANDLLSVLKEALKTNDASIIDFCKKNIYPLWESSVSESWKPITNEEKDIQGKFI